MVRQAKLTLGLNLELGVTVDIFPIKFSIFTTRERSQYQQITRFDYECSFGYEFLNGTTEYSIFS